MKIDTILTEVHRNFKSKGRPPRAREPQMRAVAVEGQRKIGGWRLVLWLARAIEDERGKNYPQMSFKKEKDGWRLDEPSRETLARIIVRPNGAKEKLA